MKNQILTALAIGIVSLALAATAQAQIKIGTVSSKKIIDGYWKTKQAEAQLKDRFTDFEKQHNDLMESYKKANEDYKKLLESANDQGVSADEREKRKKTAESKLLEIKEVETQVGQFDRTARSTMSEQRRRMLDSILKEAQDVITAKAKAGGYLLVLDSSAESMSGFPVLPYVSPENDLTEEVIRQLNANAPADLPKTDDKPAGKPSDKK